MTDQLELPRRVEIAPMSPVAPAGWTPEVHAAAYAHAAECYPAEAAGVVEDGAYVRLANISNTPNDDVVLSDEDLTARRHGRPVLPQSPRRAGLPERDGHDLPAA